MYEFAIVDINNLDIDDFNNFERKVPFTTLEWLNYLKKLKNIKPIILSVSFEGKRIGYFTGGIVYFMGVKVLGSPFWGWIGQHMGFDLRKEVNKSVLIDDLIDYAENKIKCRYVQVTDLKFTYEDIELCSHKLIGGEQYRTCYIDLTLPQETLFKNLKSGYRTCVRKFDKDGGTIEEDYSEGFIDEHEKQLREVFDRQKVKAPDYRKKMCLLYSDESISHGATANMGVYSIKALLTAESGDSKNNIASSYYIHNDYLAMFASNASYSKYLKSCPNQALTWKAICAFKEAGIKVLDMGGSGNYKLNYGADWDPRPIIIHTNSKYVEFVILGAKRSYGRIVHSIGKIKAYFKRKIQGLLKRIIGTPNE